MLTVAVIGAGAEGRRFALACAVAGYKVVLEDVLPSKLRTAQALLDEAADGVGESVRFAMTVEDAVREADLAVDFVPDELESKLEIFSMIDRMAPPKTIMCTPSDALSITDLASCTYRADKCVAVRVVGGGLLGDAEGIRLLHGPATSAETVGMVTAFWEKLGKRVTSEFDPDIPELMKNQKVR